MQARWAVWVALGRFDTALPLLENISVVCHGMLFFTPCMDDWREDPRFMQLRVKLHCAGEYKIARAELALAMERQAENK